MDDGPGAGWESESTPCSIGLHAHYSGEDEAERRRCEFSFARISRMLE